MSGPLPVARVAAPGLSARPAAALAAAVTPGGVRLLARRIGGTGLRRTAWTLRRTGRPGLLGIALLLAAPVFLLSTHLQVSEEADALRAELASRRAQARPPPEGGVARPAATVRALPDRAEVPSLLRRLFDGARQARLAVDTAKYEVSAPGGGEVVRYEVSFPVTGPYPRVRAFLDETLAAMPALALSDLALERRSIAAGTVKARIRMTLFTRGAR